ncbi:NADPH-dependent FMN reductase [Pseudactinotalea sp. HY158]|uniref:NADPH-dependent FMN reductase n=1 Tax=Pseudactinotalea sp. HY158 TaxID=2654547 RepID=UPI00129C3EF8|nr:NAD(P)H-dependent oxidoreductase [Pseudactinotalea sp. HY158]QGH68201.1 NADPH-dependent FMN reductase [Pseudactinotalea sp. HY158]
MKIAIIVGSTRPGRLGSQVGAWVAAHATDRDEATFEVLEVADFGLSLLDEATIPGAADREYENPRTREWSTAVDSYDGFVFVAPEYNHSVSAAMKNAFDVLYPEWAGKTVAFVGYGASGGIRAVEHWRGIVANASMFATRNQVAVNTLTDFPGGELAPSDRLAADLTGVLDELVTLTSRIGSPALAI